MRAHYKEFFLFRDVTVMFILLVPLLLFTFVHALSWQVWLSFVIGMSAYALSEYMVHRFLFHMKTPSNPLLLKTIKRLHFDHHADPNNLHLLFLPLWFSLPNFLIASALFLAAEDSFTLTAAFLTGVMTYFLYYEWKHYVAHKPIQPRTAVGKQVKKAHLWHHFKNENYWYGVTHTSVDKTLGTYRDQTTVKKSETARNLEKRVP
ncbi:sterol desaturase family protein [Planococcus lenghuensis]|uniref:Fatty acid hydroxylase n=1 Tax=Planococcus lenghuensis TaxID=2213202 RepID=A0A1Q2KW40_9BACL|nr:sterol desaturase family protein [Planococcus lenghuensis]AQQ52334.1 fatty acid hydroxylase [Planococcus lenghuensis]